VVGKWRCPDKWRLALSLPLLGLTSGCVGAHPRVPECTLFLAPRPGTLHGREAQRPDREPKMALITH